VIDNSFFFLLINRKGKKMNRKTYLPGGRIVHRVKGRGLNLLGVHLPEKRIKEIEYAVKGGGISEAAIKRLEELKPRIPLVTKRPNIKF